MTKLNNVIQLLAKRAFKKHKFIKEWGVFILITLILKVAAMAFSVFAGFFYFNNLFLSILNNALLANVFAVVILIIIEVLTAISLTKFFKFGIRFEIKKALPILLIAALFFSISFISSTNGLALRQSKKVDNTELITKQHNLHVLNINSVKSLQKAEIKEQISVIKSNPQGWTNGRRSTLLTAQLNQIDNYFLELKALEKNRKHELNITNLKFKKDIAANNKGRANEAEKYYKIVVSIMTIIFLINGLLVFFYSNVFYDTEKDLLAVEVVDNFSSDITDKATTLIESQINDTFAMYFSAIQNSFDSQNAENLPSVSPSKIGFKPDDKQDGKAVTHVQRGQTVTNGTDVEKRRCLHCGNEFDFKHWAKKYCSTKCRKADWEKKNNKKLNI